VDSKKKKKKREERKCEIEASKLQETFFEIFFLFSFMYKNNKIFI